MVGADESKAMVIFVALDFLDSAWCKGDARTVSTNGVAAGEGYSRRISIRDSLYNILGYGHIRSSHLTSVGKL
jgi:hypothetical protein